MPPGHQRDSFQAARDRFEQFATVPLWRSTQGEGWHGCERGLGATSKSIAQSLLADSQTAGACKARRSVWRSAAALQGRDLVTSGQARSAEFSSTHEEASKRWQKEFDRRSKDALAGLRQPMLSELILRMPPMHGSLDADLQIFAELLLARLRMEGADDALAKPLQAIIVAPTG